MWECEIRQAIKTADIFIACLSTQSVNKRGVFQKELKYAFDVLGEFPEGHIYIIPVRIDDCFVPDGLKPIQYVDWFRPNARSMLLQSICSTNLEERAVPHNISGVWNSIFGDVRLMQHGEMITGEYSYRIIERHSKRSGRLHGKIVGNKVIFQWIESTGITGVGYWREESA